MFDGCESFNESRGASVRINDNLLLLEPTKLNCPKSEELYTSVVANGMASEFGRVFLVDDNVQVYVGSIYNDSGAKFYFADWLNSANVTTVSSETFLRDYCPQRSHWRGKLDMNLRQSSAMSVIESTLCSTVKRKSTRSQHVRGLEHTAKATAAPSDRHGTPNTRINPNEPVSVSKISPDCRVGKIVALKNGAPVGIIVSQEQDHSRVKV